MNVHTFFLNMSAFVYIFIIRVGSENVHSIIKISNYEFSPNYSVDKYKM